MSSLLMPGVVTAFWIITPTPSITSLARLLIWLEVSEDSTTLRVALAFSIFFNIKFIEVSSRVDFTVNSIALDNELTILPT